MSTYEIVYQEDAKGVNWKDLAEVYKRAPLGKLDPGKTPSRVRRQRSQLSCLQRSSAGWRRTDDFGRRGACDRLRACCCAGISAPGRRQGDLEIDPPETRRSQGDPGVCPRTAGFLPTRRVSQPQVGHGAVREHAVVRRKRQSGIGRPGQRRSGLFGLNRRRFGRFDMRRSPIYREGAIQ